MLQILRIINNRNISNISFAGYLIYAIAIRDQLSNGNNSNIKYGKVGEGSRAISAEIAEFAKGQRCQSGVQRIFL